MRNLISAVFIAGLCGATSAQATSTTTLGFEGTATEFRKINEFGFNQFGYQYFESGYAVSNTSFTGPDGLPSLHGDVTHIRDSSVPVQSWHMEHTGADISSTHSVSRLDGSTFDAFSFDYAGTASVYEDYDTGELLLLKLKVGVNGYRNGAVVANQTFEMDTPITRPNHYGVQRPYLLSSAFTNIDRVQFFYDFSKVLTTSDGRTGADLLAMGYTDRTGDYWDAHGDLDNVVVSSVTSVTPVPVPAGGLLLIGGLAALGGLRRRRRVA